MVRRASIHSIAVALVLTAAALATGCGTTPPIEYSKSSSQPIVSYDRTQALPPEYSPRGPVFIVYGDGTAFRREGLMDYRTGKLTEAQLKGLVTSITDRGFFEMKQQLGNPKPGGAVDHVTVTLSSRSTSVEAPEGAGGDFGAIVSELRAYVIPDEKEYLPDRITLHAAEDPAGQKNEGKVLEWTADPNDLALAAEGRSGATGGAQLTGAEAQKVWKLLRDASSTQGTVAWSAGGKIYTNVYADAYFPAPGV